MFVVSLNIIIVFALIGFVFSEKLNCELIVDFEMTDVLTLEIAVCFLCCINNIVSVSQTKVESKRSQTAFSPNTVMHNSDTIDA